jgi:restriction system protein
MAQKIAQFVNPVLTALKRLGGSGRPSEVCEAVAHDMGLEGSSMLEETLRSGVSRFENKIAWVRQYLVLAGYIDRSERGVWALTAKGRSSPALSEEEANRLVLEMQRQDRERRGKRLDDVGGNAANQDDTSREVNRDNEEEEEEEDEEGSSYRSQLLAIIRALSPKGFEQLCQRLLRESGFERVVVTGGAGDRGIDGIGDLKINPFVTLKVQFQCKRYVGTVGPSEVREFRGAMQGRADKGLILTTGTFSPGALDEAARDGVPPIELVDAERLIGLFEKLHLGLVSRKTYDVDPVFFTQFDSNVENSS